VLRADWLCAGTTRAQFSDQLPRLTQIRVRVIRVRVRLRVRLRVRVRFRVRVSFRVTSFRI